MAIDPFEGPVQRPVTGRNAEALHVGSEAVRSGQPTGQRVSRMSRAMGLLDRSVRSGRSPEAQATQERSNATNQAVYKRGAKEYVNDMLKTPGDIFNAPEPDLGRLDPNRKPDKFA